jgi:hypothetical protein
MGKRATSVAPTLSGARLKRGRLVVDEGATQMMAALPVRVLLLLLQGYPSGSRALITASLWVRRAIVLPLHCSNSRIARGLGSLEPFSVLHPSRRSLPWLAFYERLFVESALDTVFVIRAAA